MLALLALALLLLELSGTLSEPWTGRVVEAQLLIWAIFVVAFLLELWLARSRVHYLRTHWLVVLSLALPLFRVFRVLRAVRFLRATRAARGLNLARVGAALNRGAREIRDFGRVSHALYLALLTAAVTVTAAVAALAFERDTNPELSSIGDALWWAATVVTTVNASAETVTLEGRIVSLLLRVFGLGVTGYVTARIAVFFLAPRERAARSDEDAEDAPTVRELRALREEVGRLASRLERDDGDERGGEPVGRRPERRR